MVFLTSDFPVIRFLLRGETGCIVSWKSQIEFGVMVCEGPKELKEIWTTLTQGIGDHRSKCQSLTEVVPGVFSSLGSFHSLESLRLETVCKVKGMADGNVHNESSVGCEIKSEICWNNASSYCHEICSFSSFLHLSFISIREAGFITSGRDSTLAGDFCEFLSKFGVRCFTSFCSMLGFVE